MFHLEFTQDGRNVGLRCKIGQDFQLQIERVCSKLLLLIHTFNGHFSRDYSGEPVPERLNPIWILDLLKQKTVSGSGISWAICKSAPRSIQITTPAPNHSVFLQAGCPSCHPANSIKALMAISYLLIKTSNKWPSSRTAQRKQHCCSHSLLLFILLGLSQLRHSIRWISYSTLIIIVYCGH